jgi:K+ transporter
MCAGDIGTSPLYTYSTVFWEPPEQLDVLCAASLVFWSITLVVLVKYVLIVMLADDNGEGMQWITVVYELINSRLSLHTAACVVACAAVQH